MENSSGDPVGLVFGYMGVNILLPYEILFDIPHKDSIVSVS